MDKKQEENCAKCFSDLLEKNGHEVGYCRGRDAPDFNFTIDGEVYSVEVTTIPGMEFLYLPDKHGPERICQRIEEKVRQIRDNSGRKPQTGHYYVDMLLPLKPRKRLEEQINRIAEIIAGAENPYNAVESAFCLYPPPWQVAVVSLKSPGDFAVKCASVGSSHEGERWDGDGGAVSALGKRLVGIFLEKKRKIERNEPDRPKILLLSAPGDVLMGIDSAWEHQSQDLRQAAMNFDCILSIMDKEGCHVYSELVPFRAHR